MLLVTISLFRNNSNDSGSEYLTEFYGSEVAAKQVEMSDIAKEQQDAQEMLQRVQYEMRVPDLLDMKKLLAEGYLIGCNVNSKKLNNQSGYAGHSILVYDLDEKYVYLHDPGLPPRPNRKVERDLFNQAWAYPGSNSKNLTAFKLATCVK